MQEPRLPSGLFDVQKELYLAKPTMGYRQILASFRHPDPGTNQDKHLSRPAAIGHCLERTALGLLWVSGHDGGHDRILCKEDDARSLAIVQT
jgi:hypothetical protein